jgi:CubicO group peptidase (beta-lactamase class C family)
MSFGIGWMTTPGENDALMASGQTPSVDDSASASPTERDTVAPAERVDAYLNAEISRQRIPGLALAVVKDGRLVLAKGYGLASVELNVPVTPETVFEIGSLTKQFTATAIMMLVEQGKLGLDEKINQRLTGLPEAWKDVTVRHLLTHTSGIKSYTSLADFPHLAITPTSLAEMVRATGQFPLEFPSGQGWQYSNSGYYLLGWVVEEASGQSYPEFLNAHIFRPLGMSSTQVNDPRRLVKNRAVGYTREDGQLRNAPYVDMSWPYAAGAIVSNVIDLAKWDAAISSHRLITSSSLEQMWTPVALTSGRTVPYGFGWDLSPTNGRQTMAHGGSIPGFLTFMARYPEDRLTVIVLTNADFSEPEQITRQVAGLFVPEFGLVRE